MRTISAEHLGAIELDVAHIGRNDQSGAGELGALDHVQAHGSATDHQHAGARLDLRLARRRAHTGHHAAADQAGAVEGISLGTAIAPDSGTTQYCACEETTEK